MKVFKKNDRVAVIHSWNNKGHMRISRAIVHSSGNKVLRLQHDNGEMFKVAHDPENNDITYNFNGIHIVHDTSDEELEKIAHDDGQRIIDKQHAHHNRLIAGRPHDEHYVASLRRDQSEIQANSSIEWDGRTTQGSQEKKLDTTPIVSAPATPQVVDTAPVRGLNHPTGKQSKAEIVLGFVRSMPTASGFAIAKAVHAHHSDISIANANYYIMKMKKKG